MIPELTVIFLSPTVIRLSVRGLGQENLLVRSSGLGNWRSNFWPRKVRSLNLLLAGVYVLGFEKGPSLSTRKKFTYQQGLTSGPRMSTPLPIQQIQLQAERLQL